MWQQPDSALAVMLQFAASPMADSMDEFDGHYCQMLISELLFKNDCAQSNRAELLEAVGYFDLVCGTETVGRDAPWHVSTHNDAIAFLTARAHYINGAGQYEQGDVVEACEEYLKALELMESHFEEKDLVGLKARFMALTYIRLLDLFSGQFMMDPAIECGERALDYCTISSTSPNGISNILLHIGKQYAKKREREKANQYYEQALENLTNRDNTQYRDIISCKALNDYEMGMGSEQPINDLRQMAAQAADGEERLTRFMTIGAIFMVEGSYDSALVYLEPVFERSDDIGVQTKMAVARYLRSVYDSIGNADRSEACVRFMADHKPSEGESKALTSQLENMYKAYTNQKQERQAKAARARTIRKAIGIAVPIALAIALALVVLWKRKSSKLLKAQQEEAAKALEESEAQHRQEKDAMTREALKRQGQQLYSTLRVGATESLVDTFRKTYPEAEERLAEAYPELTETERKILVLSVFDFRQKEVAELLGIRENTVAHCRQSIKKKASCDDFVVILEPFLA